MTEPAPLRAPEPSLGRRLVSLAECCEAVVNLLHGTSLSKPFIASREWMPTFDLSSIGDTVKVSVAAGDGYTVTRLARSNWQRDPQVRVFIHANLSGQKVDEQIDELMAFSEEVRFALCNAELPLEGCWSGCRRMYAISVDSDPPLSLDMLENLRQFSSVLMVTYRIID